VADLTAYLATLPTGSEESPAIVPLTGNFSEVWGAINTAVRNSGKYVVLDLSTCTATDNTIVSSELNTKNNDFNTIRNNIYIKGIMLPSTLTSIGDYAFSYGTTLASVTFAIGSNITTAWNNSIHRPRQRHCNRCQPVDGVYRRHQSGDVHLQRQHVDADELARA
jgi:hypothetical protein